MQKTIKRPFTLLEICLVMAIMAGGVCYLGIQGWHMVQTQRFERGVHDFARYLSTCTLQGICAQQDSHIRLVQTQAGVFYENKSQKIRVQLPEVKQLFCKKKAVTSCSIHLFSTGEVIAEGPLVFQSSSKKLSLSTSPFFSVSSYEVADENFE